MPVARSRTQKAPQVRGEAVVSRVLEAAVEELALHGLEGLSLERVAARARVNRTTIFRRWPTRQALAKAAVERAAHQVDFRWDEGSLRADLALLIARAQEKLAANGLLTLQRLGPVLSSAPGLRAIILRAQRARHAAAHAMLDRAQARGELRADLDRELFLDSLLGLLISKQVFKQEPLDAPFIQRVLDHLTQVAQPAEGGARVRGRAGARRS